MTMQSTISETIGKIGKTWPGRALLCALCAVLLGMTVGSLDTAAAEKQMPDGTLFDAEYYAQQNPDVVAAFGNSEEMLYRHYVLAGKAEGRAATKASVTVTPNHSIGLKGVSNARELGGYVTTEGKNVKPGLLLRTGKLSGAKAEDIIRLQTVYNLGAILDLRTLDEIVPYRDPSIPGALYYHLDILDNATRTKQYDRYYAYMAEHPGASAGEMLGMLKTVGVVHDNMYVDYLTKEPGITGYRNMFRILLDTPDGHAVLFHCSSGKDRTGVAAMLILGTLGCSDEVILNDFLLTNSYSGRAKGFQDSLAASGLNADDVGDMIVTMDGVNKKHMLNALQYIHANYGTVTGYVKTVLGYSDADIARLKSKYLQ